VRSAAERSSGRESRKRKWKRAAQWELGKREAN